MSETEPLAQQCFYAIEYAIMTGEYLPGRQLKINDLRQRFNVGGSAIREALSKLVSFGLVIHEGKKGFKVAHVSEEEVQDLFQTFAQVECLALQLSIARGDADWEANVVAALHKLSVIELSDQVELDTWFDVNEAFHSALVQGCHSPHLLAIRDGLSQKVARYIRLQFLQQSAELEINSEEHHEIAQVALQRNSEAAQELVQAHILDGMPKLIEKLKEIHLL